MSAIIGWNTAKTANGFEFSVTKTIARETPNEAGRYADTTIIHRGLKATRAQAKSAAQKAARYFKQKGC